jgi:class 3 adenylate cyclase
VVSRMSNGVVNWLKEIGLDKYIEVFAENDVDLRVLPELSEQDLKELGVSLGHRRILQRAISELGEQPASPTSSVSEHDVASTSPSREAERRQLTVMFCDLVGSTALASKLDPEDLREVITSFQDKCREAIDRYSGFIARYMGDGMLVYFGYPQAHEDDAERAARAGLDIVRAMTMLNIGVGKRHEVVLAVRIGVATGSVVVGDIVGEGAAEEAAVVGETPNLAARLQGVAEPNQVVVASVTRRLLGALFEYDDLGTHELKGIAQPVQVWRVVREHDFDRSLTAGGAAGGAGAVGALVGGEQGRTRPGGADSGRAGDRQVTTTRGAA